METIKSILSIVILLIIAIVVASIPTMTETPRCIGIHCIPPTTKQAVLEEETTEVYEQNDPEEKPEEKKEITSLPSITEPAVPVIEVPAIDPIEEPVVTSTVATPLSEVNTYARAALVNILCVAQNASAVGSITGSGVFIDPQGIILTNAHIAQYLLVDDWPTENSLDCTIRMGSPAVPLYRAEILYISPQWIAENNDVIVSEHPKGTGEFDYALLRIYDTTDPNGTLPQSFPYVEFRTNEYGDELEGSTVLLAAYPAGFTGGISIIKDLYAASSITSVGKLYTFATTTVDVFSLGGTIVAQEGSSGGAVVNRDKQLIGLIVTSTSGPTTDDRDLRAITLPYINRDFKSFSGIFLKSFLTRNLEVEAQAFNQLIAPALREALVQSLEE